MNIHGIEFPDLMESQTYECLETIMGQLAKEEGGINKLDCVAWRMLAGNLNFYFDSERKVVTDGMTRESSQKNMAVSSQMLVNLKIQGNIMTILKELGLTTASRSRMRKIEEKEEETLLETLLKGGKN